MTFLVLPDHPASRSVARQAETWATSVIPHASGHPWIVGDWTQHELTWAAAGRSRIALLGCSSATAADLEAALGRISATGAVDREVDGLTRRLAGCAHLLVSIDGRVRAQGTLSTVCQLFHARWGDIVVAADRPQVLATAIGADLKTELIAARLLAPAAPWPLNEWCLWRGVESLPLGCYLALHADGSGRTTRWWTPPPPHLPLAEAAALVRSALADAVHARTASAGTVTADLSGGMDSTSVCFLAASTATPRLLATRWEAEGDVDDDRVWAERAAATLESVDYRPIGRREAPLWFSGAGEPDPDVEGPFPFIRTRSRLVALAAELGRLGSTTHLTGHGGDELFFTSPQQLHTLVRTHPVQALRNLRTGRAMYRWKLVPTARGLLDHASFGAWLSAAGRSLADPPPTMRAPNFAWGTDVRMPRWATRDAVAATAELMHRASVVEPEPLSPIRAQHATLQDARLSGESIRRTKRLTARSGVSWEAPFLDDRVLEAALSVRYQDCSELHRYKPVLATAMRGIVPDDILQRPTKAEFSAEAYAGLRKNRGELLDLCEDLELARLGLIDADALRSALLGQHASSLTLVPLDGTLACESWLRSTMADVRSTVGTGGAR